MKRGSVIVNLAPDLARCVRARGYPRRRRLPGGLPRGASDSFIIL
jgi:hypothetical protein